MGPGTARFSGRAQVAVGDTHLLAQSQLAGGVGPKNVTRLFLLTKLVFPKKF